MVAPRIPLELTSGPFTRRQAFAAGLTSHNLRSSAWRQVFQGVWILAEIEDTPAVRLAAARLVVPAPGVLRGLTTAWVHGVDVRRLDDLDVHVGALSWLTR